MLNCVHLTEEKKKSQRDITALKGDMYLKLLIVLNVACTVICPLPLHMTSSPNQLACRSVSRLVTVRPLSLQWCYVWLKWKLILTVISTGSGPGDRLSLARWGRLMRTHMHIHTNLIFSSFFFFGDIQHFYTHTQTHIHTQGTYLQHDTVFCSNGCCRKQNRARRSHT